MTERGRKFNFKVRKLDVIRRITVWERSHRHVTGRLLGNQRGLESVCRRNIFQSYLDLKSCCFMTGSHVSDVPDSHTYIRRFAKERW